MGGLEAFLIAYVVGGLTFLPLVLGLVLLHAYLTLPSWPSDSHPSTTDNVGDPGDDGKNIRSGAAALEKKFLRSHEPDVAEGYFAVCREYVPGGVNGKPPERTTPAGEVVAEESPSVYQSMYRSIFDRKQAPTMEAAKGNKAAKRARNVFYVVLRHGHLMLYDDSEQIEVRHVISLAHHDVSVYGGGNEIPEGELWIKRNAICLTRKEIAGDITALSKPFYFFSENCSDKEDFYFALLQDQERSTENPTRPPEPQRYEVKDIISLVQRLHSSEEHLQTRWINAIVGRLFLAVYRTPQMEDLVRMKITKKIARVKMPAFLSGIVLQKINLGAAAPIITNPHLKELTVDGDCVVEADFKYDGRFRIEIAATVRIDLGTRFKAREVNLVLAAVIKKLEGHVLIRLKPPPSNRIWYSFESMPKLEMTIEPVVSARQITYGIVLRAIESRIREVIAETLVLPHWDDSPFTSTLHQRYRGGIWTVDEGYPSISHRNSTPDEGPEQDNETELMYGSESPDMKPVQDERSTSMPALVDTLPNPGSRKSHKSNWSTESTDSTASFGTPRRTEMPKAIRSRSFAAAADPILSMDNANVNSAGREGKTRIPKDAASVMTEISNRSQPASPLDSPAGLGKLRSGSFLNVDQSGSVSSTSSKRSSVQDLSASQDTITDLSTVPPSDTPSEGDVRSLSSHPEPEAHRSPSLQSTTRSLNPTDKKQKLQAIGAAAAAAKSWGWNAISRNISQGKVLNLSNRPDAEKAPPQPIGRGRPLPPPGQPLPRPEKRKATPLVIPKRKPLAAPALPERRQDETKARQASAPALPARHRDNDQGPNDSGDSRVMVVEAPPDSEPTSPLDDGFGDYMDNVNVDEESNDEISVASQGSSEVAPHADPAASSASQSNEQSVSAAAKDLHSIPTWQAVHEEESTKVAFADDQGFT